ncbi:hypothetical protein BBL17_014725 [Agrobacterium vitis]|uniref:FMN hydroxy acid dehydrogenase domain-containing protein n=1 Tax=Agrobacterium vitis TaxID=373 RepID=A0ABW9TF02_AGRVI|nr:hypothetical protein [Agrobacterium vitis]
MDDARSKVPILIKRHERNIALEAGNISDLRQTARRRLPKGLFEFFDRGSEDETALRAARLAFDDLRIRPQVMVDVSACRTDVTLFGKSLDAPIIAAPTGIGDLLWPDGELALAKAAGSARLPFVLSMSSTTSLERLSALDVGQFWFQLYLWDDRRHSQEVVQRAQAAGASTLVLTVDTAVTANREYNARNGFGLRSGLRLTSHAIRDGFPPWSCDIGPIGGCWRMKTIRLSSPDRFSRVRDGRQSRRPQPGTTCAGCGKSGTARCWSRAY